MSLRKRVRGLIWATRNYRRFGGFVQQIANCGICTTDMELMCEDHAHEFQDLYEEIHGERKSLEELDIEAIPTDDRGPTYEPR